MRVIEQLIIQLKAAGKAVGTNNGWEKNGIEYFYEVGREQRDGAVVGSVHKMYKVENANYCKPAGTFRAEPDGTIRRFPTSTKIQRQVATTAAIAEEEKRKPLVSVSW